MTPKIRLRVGAQPPENAATTAAATPAPPTPAPTKDRASETELLIMKDVLKILYEHKDEEGNELSVPFQEMVLKRDLPDYYRVIKTPMALTTIQNKIKRKMYATFSDFVKDCTQIFHNAKFYNRPVSEIYKHAEILEGILREELLKLAKADPPKISMSDTELPDLGPLPSPSPTPEPEDAMDEDNENTVEVNADENDEEGDDDDEDDEEESQDDEDSDGGRRRGRRRRANKKAADEDALNDGGSPGAVKKASVAADPRKKRGRPPRVDTPFESRIKAIIKSIRKCKDEDGETRYLAFEKLPDLKQFPEYYQEVRDPIAIDGIKKKVKRREYDSVDNFMEDVNLMFENAKSYNEDDSKIYKDAIALQEEANKVAEIEKGKDDSEYQAGNTEASKHFNRIPLRSIEHKGEIYQVGDWIHILNPNDLAKPTVGQIFRTWKDPENKIWINACWYYRPEQTVHRVDKRFFENEVCKTGQYRDHQIDEVLDKCFVMFFTKYSRGRPKNAGNKKIYVCEARYNETAKHFNRIKTWKSCIPDEVRSQDYEMDLYDKQVVLRKFHSPLQHLLPANATDTDPLPNATLGAENAPPVIGAVFRRPRGPNDSPPPEPTPPPAPAAPVAPMRTPSISRHISTDTPISRTPADTYSNKGVMQTPIIQTPMPSYPQTMPKERTTSFNLQPIEMSMRPQPTPYQTQPPLMRHSSSSSSVPQSFPSHQHQQIQQPPSLSSQSMAYEPPAPPTAFTIPEVKIDPEIAKHFLTDDRGEILWFTTPPINVAFPDPSTTTTATTISTSTTTTTASSQTNVPTTHTSPFSPSGGLLGHSAAYLARLPEIQARRKRKMGQRQAEAKKQKLDLEALKQKGMERQKLVAITYLAEYLKPTDDPDADLSKLVPVQKKILTS